MNKTERATIAHALLHAAETLEACGDAMMPMDEADTPVGPTNEDEGIEEAIADEPGLPSDLALTLEDEDDEYGGALDDDNTYGSALDDESMYGGQTDIDFDDEPADEPVSMDDSIIDPGTMSFADEDEDLEDDEASAQADERDILASSIRLSVAKASGGWVAHARAPGVPFAIAASATSRVEALKMASLRAAAYLDEVEDANGVVSAAKKKITPAMRKRMAQKAKKNATKGKKVFHSTGAAKKARKGGWKATAVFSRKGIKGKDGKPRKFTQQIRLGGKSKPILKVQGGKLMITTKDAATGQRGTYQYGAPKK